MVRQEEIEGIARDFLRLSEKSKQKLIDYVDYLLKIERGLHNGQAV